MENTRVPGNFGLKDIVMALRWVQENIEVFHGDPKSVTLWGHSAGAIATHILASSQKTEGLFHRCILQSGNIFGLWTLNRKGWTRRFSMNVARLLDCLPCNSKATNIKMFLTTSELNDKQQCTCDDFYGTMDEEDEDMILKCMRNKTAEEIVQTVPAFVRFICF